MYTVPSHESHNHTSVCSTKGNVTGTSCHLCKNIILNILMKGAQKQSLSTLCILSVGDASRWVRTKSVISKKVIISTYFIQLNKLGLGHHGTPLKRTWAFYMCSANRSVKIKKKDSQCRNKLVKYVQLARSVNILTGNVFVKCSCRCYGKKLLQELLIIL